MPHYVPKGAGDTNDWCITLFLKKKEEIERETVSILGTRVIHQDNMSVHSYPLIPHSKTIRLWEFVICFEQKLDIYKKIYVLSKNKIKNTKISTRA